MRILKFRAWCILEKKGSFVYFDLSDTQSFNFDIMDSPPVVQQFTGLQDMNGYDIYEGDLLSYRRLTDNETPISMAPVVFSPFGYGFVLDSSGRHKIGDTKYGDYIPLVHTEVSGMVYEIVGNIFENPELLR